MRRACAAKADVREALLGVVFFVERIAEVRFRDERRLPPRAASHHARVIVRAVAQRIDVAEVVVAFGLRVEDPRVRGPLGDVARLIARAERARAPDEAARGREDRMAVAVIGIAEELQRHRRLGALDLAEDVRALLAMVEVLWLLELAPRPDRGRVVAARRALPFGLGG